MQKQHSRLDMIPGSAIENLKKPNQIDDNSLENTVDNIVMQEQLEAGSSPITEELICPNKTLKSNKLVQLEVCPFELSSHHLLSVLRLKLSRNVPVHHRKEVIALHTSLSLFHSLCYENVFVVNLKWLSFFNSNDAFAE